MTNYLIDTHPIILKETPCLHKKLSKKILNIFKRVEEGKDSIFVPTPVIWELGFYHKKNNLKIKNQPLFRHWIQNRVLRHTNVNFVEANLEDLLLAAGLTVNSDPFDNLIVATASRLDMPLITKDQAITESGTCKVVW